MVATPTTPRTHYTGGGGGRVAQVVLPSAPFTTASTPSTTIDDPAPGAAILTGLRGGGGAGVEADAVLIVNICLLLLFLKKLLLLLLLFSGLLLEIPRIEEHFPLSFRFNNLFVSLQRVGRQSSSHFHLNDMNIWKNKTETKISIIISHVVTDKVSLFGAVSFIIN